MITVSLDIILLKAASLSAAKKDIRPALNGVYVDLNDRNLHATNGHLAFMSRPNSITVTNTEQETGFIIPNSMIEQILKIKYGKSTEQRVLTITCNNANLTATLCGVSLTGTTDEARFPDIKRIYHLNDSLNKPISTYDYRYLNIVADTQKTLMPLLPKEHTGVTLTIGQAKAAFSLGDDLAHILIMGMRDHKAFSFYQFGQGDKK